MTLADDATAWADKIDERLGPISGADADRLARFLRRVAETSDRFTKDRSEQDLALADAIRETASTADELAFWKYRAIYATVEYDRARAALEKVKAS